MTHVGWIASQHQMAVAALLLIFRKKAEEVRDAEEHKAEKRGRMLQEQFEAHQRWRQKNGWI